MREGRWYGRSASRVAQNGLCTGGSPFCIGDFGRAPRTPATPVRQRPLETRYVKLVQLNLHVAGWDRGSCMIPCGGLAAGGGAPGGYWVRLVARARQAYSSRRDLSSHVRRFTRTVVTAVSGSERVTRHFRPWRGWCTLSSCHKNCYISRLVAFGGLAVM